MKIDFINLTVKSFDYGRDCTQIQISVRTDMEEYGISEIVQDNHFESYFDVLWRRLGDELKSKALKSTK